MPLTRIDSAFLDLDAIGGIDFDVQSGIPTLKVDAVNHRIGIGNNSPTQKLDVAGNVNISSGSNYLVDGSQISTANVAENTSYLYFTDARATSAITGFALDMGSNNITTTGKVLFANMYSAIGDLPSASTYHGMFAHVHGTGRGYFAHGGNWIRLIDENGGSLSGALTSTSSGSFTSLSTGASGVGVNISTSTISGPATLTIDPAAVGDNTGTVVIAGDLQVDGTTTTINSTTLTVDDKNLVLASGAANNAAADGAGITIDTADATLLYKATPDAWVFNKNVGIGTDDPQEKLHLDTGTLLVTNTTAPQIRLSADNTDASDNDRTMLGQATANSHFVSTAVDNDTVLRGTSTGNILFGVGTSEKLRITSGGLVSIPVAGSLQVGGASSGETDTKIYVANTGGNAYIQLKGADSTGTVGLKFGRNSVANRAGIDWSAATDKLTVRTGGTDPRITVTSGGNVGIGTDNPISGKLHVQDGNIRISGTSENVLKIRHDSASSDSNISQTSDGSLRYRYGTNEKFRIDSDGIITAGNGNSTGGTTLIQNYYSSPHILNVIGSHYSTGGTSICYAVRPKVANSGFVSSAGNANFKKAVLEINGEFVFRSAGAATVPVGDDVTLAQVMKIDNSGKMGLGFTAESATLEVQGQNAYTSSANSLATSTSKAALRVKGSTNSSDSLWVGVETSNAQPYLQGANGIGNTAKNLLLNPFGANVGIGTDNPGDKLVVHQGSDDDIILRVNGADSTTEFAALGAGSGYASFVAGGSQTTNTDMVLMTTSGGTETERLRITSNGDVGIGTATPITASGYANLSLVNSSGAQIELKKTGNNSTHYIWTDGTADLNIGANYSGTTVGDLIIKVGGNNERLRIRSNGDLILGPYDAPGSYTNAALNVPYQIKVAPFGWQHHSEIAAISMGNHGGSTGSDDGEIVFKTTSNAHSSTTGLVERLRIDSNGDSIFYGNPSIDARDLYYKNTYATNGWSTSNWYTVVPHGLTSNSTYLVVLVWDFGGSLGQPYYLATQQLYSTVNGTNGTGSDNEMTPMVSTHTGGSGAKINCRVLAQASGTPAMQVNLSWGQGTNSYLRVKVWKMLFANRSA